MRAYLLSVEGLEYAVLAAKVSQGRTVGMDRPQLHKYIDELGRSAGKVYYWLLSSVVHGHPAMDYENIMEHVIVRLFIEAPRYVTHQIVRHRLASYAQESQRYSEIRLMNLIKDLAEEIGTDYKDFRPSIGEIVAKEAMHKLSKEELCPIIQRHLGCERADPSTVLMAIAEYWRARKEGKSPQEAREILPQCVQSQIYMTVNLRELLHIVSQRLSARAQPEHAKIWAQIWRELWERSHIPTAHMLLFKSPRTYAEATSGGLIHTIEEEENIWHVMTPEQRRYLVNVIRNRQEIPDSAKNQILKAAIQHKQNP